MLPIVARLLRHPLLSKQPMARKAVASTSHEGDQLTLQISGTTGQLTKVEADGEQEVNRFKLMLHQPDVGHWR